MEMMAKSLKISQNRTIEHFPVSKLLQTQITSTKQKNNQLKWINSHFGLDYSHFELEMV